MQGKYEMLNEMLSEMESEMEDRIVKMENRKDKITYLASGRIRQASGSKRARDASYTFTFLLYNNV